MAFPYFDQVTRAHDELISEGKIKHRSSQEEVEQDKGLLTRRAGYYAHEEDDTTIGLLEKTSGNNSLGYSVDCLVDKRGTFWDVATDSSGMAMPVNGGPGGPDPELGARWRTPTAELAGLDDSDTGTDPIPFDDGKAVEFGLACNDVYIESQAAVDPGMISVHSQRCAYDYYVLRMPWDECLEKHTNEFRAEYGLPPLSSTR